MEASDPLDAYSQIVSSVAEQLTPKVASLRVPRGQGRGQVAVIKAEAIAGRASAPAWSSPATGSC